MKPDTYYNSLISKKQLRQLLASTFQTYDSIQAANVADDLKEVGFQYATHAGISISIEDLKIPPSKTWMVRTANQEIETTEKLYQGGKLTEVERFQSVINLWSQTSETLKQQIIQYFKTYDPLNSVYIMAFSGARGNLSQVRQLVGMRGLMANTNGELINLAIQTNFREGLSLTDYLVSGYGARKGIVDTALKTANAGYLTRRLIDVSHDIVIREKNCFTPHSFVVSLGGTSSKEEPALWKILVGRVLHQTVRDPETREVVAWQTTPITPELLRELQQKQIPEIYIRSPFTCQLYRAICQKCYGWDLANQNLVDLGTAVGILAGQSIGEPGTQLTMRTFHTGGVFTSQLREKIYSPVTGIVKFPSNLESSRIRTERGEEVSITKNAGSILILPEDPNQPLARIEVPKNILLFPNQNQYIQQDQILGEILDTKVQTQTELKPIRSETGGEVVMPRLTFSETRLTTSKLIWVLAGTLYHSPHRSFVNFYSDYSISPENAIFRTKLIASSPGVIAFTTLSANLDQRVVKVRSHHSEMAQATLRKLTKGVQVYQYLLTVADCHSLLRLDSKDSQVSLPGVHHLSLGKWVTSAFRTLTGGTLYYDLDAEPALVAKASPLSWIGVDLKQYWLVDPTNTFRTILWLGEEVYHLKCDPKYLLVPEGTVISKNCEILPGVRSRTGGRVEIVATKKAIRQITIRSGRVYDSLEADRYADQVYYPGESLESQLVLQSPSICEVVEDHPHQFLVRPLELFEVPYQTPLERKLQQARRRDGNLPLTATSCYLYPVEQTIQQSSNLDLVASFLRRDAFQFQQHQLHLEVTPHWNQPGLVFQTKEVLPLPQYVRPSLRSKNLQSCLVVQPQQFIDQYTLLVYLEALAPTGLQMVSVKVKWKRDGTKQILVISNDDCFTVDKKKFPTKQVQDFLVETDDSQEQGKILLENPEVFTVQKGKPYFFPNCRNETVTLVKNLTYKTFPRTAPPPPVTLPRQLAVSYRDWKKLYQSPRNPFRLKHQFRFQDRKLFLTKNGKLYSTVMPLLVKRFSIQDSKEVDPLWMDLLPPSQISRRLWRRMRRSLEHALQAERKRIRAKERQIQKLERAGVHVPLTLEESENNWELFTQVAKTLTQELMTSFQIAEPEDTKPRKKNRKKDKELDPLLAMERRVRKKFVFFCTKPALPPCRTSFLPENVEQDLEERFRQPETLLFLQKQWISFLSAMKPKRRILLQRTQLKSHRGNDRPATSTVFTLATWLGTVRKGRQGARVLKKMRLHAMTDDYYEEEVNRIFCQPNDFLEEGETLGWLSLEKEFTSDIVQGLPRVEEILEARKNRDLPAKRPTSQKQGILLQRTSLDPSFEFKPLGTALKENEKIRAHQLLRVYFNYYGSPPPLKERPRFVNNVDYYGDPELMKWRRPRLVNNLEGSYKSFKKVQSFILNSVQSVYFGQGVFIHDKHLEVIIKQMTTRVRITHSGDADLLEGEVMDLYHLDKINQMLPRFYKPVEYVPILFGITKAALHNPSFLSAASFQETTRVLTKAAIEGRYDWLRGLKENIIVGQLIPAGSGTRNYRTSFRPVGRKKNHPKPNPNRSLGESKSARQGVSSLLN